jgi:preprotein translocase subunit SecG
VTHSKLRGTLCLELLDAGPSAIPDSSKQPPTDSRNRTLSSFNSYFPDSLTLSETSGIGSLLSPGDALTTQSLSGGYGQDEAELTLQRSSTTATLASFFFTVAIALTSLAAKKLQVTSA